MNHSLCNHYSKEQKLCWRAASLFRARLFRFYTTWYFSNLMDFTPEAKPESRWTVTTMTPCQDQFALLLHHLAVQTRTYLQPKKIQKPTQLTFWKSVFWIRKSWARTRKIKLCLNTSHTKNTYCIFRMEDVRCRRIIYYNNFTQLTSQSTQILHIISSVENTGFSKEPCPEHTPAIQQVGYWVCILKNRS